MDKELLKRYKERNPEKYEQKFGKQEIKVDESVETPKKKNLLKKIING